MSPLNALTVWIHSDFCLLFSKFTMSANATNKIVSAGSASCKGERTINTVCVLDS